MRRRLAIVLVLLLALTLGAYLLLWPVPVEPKAWSPPVAPARMGSFAPNERLRGVERIGRGVATGPEATAIDAGGRLFTGTSDGRILRLDPGASALVEVARTGGRPLGLAAAPDGRLFVADARRGLLEISAGGEVQVLATEHGGLPFALTDDVVLARDGTLYFTDASSRFGWDQVREDVLEHGGSGRLFAWHPADDGRPARVELLAAGLNFANGLALSQDETQLIVAETGAYRLLRCWLRGWRAGRVEPFVENLPGLPDNVSWSSARGAFWVALYSPRMLPLDLLGPWPALRKMALRTPTWLQPQPGREAAILAVDEQGRIVEWLLDTSTEAYAPVTSVREHDGVLWLGSLGEDGLGRIAAPPLRP